MTPAELKTIRESLGLTAQWVADQANVKLRTMQYWESGRMAVPADVSTMILRIDAQLNSTVQQALTELLANGKPRQVALVRYRTDEDLWRYHPEMAPLPATTHAAMIARMRMLLQAQSIDSIIDYLDADSGDHLTQAEWARTIL